MEKSYRCIVMNKKISLVIGGLRGGGAERVCVTLANGLVENGYDVDLVVLSLKDAVMQEDLSKQVNLVDLKVEHARNSFYVLLKYLRYKKPGIILSFNSEISVILGMLRLIFRLKYRLVSRCINYMSQVASSKSGLWYGVIAGLLIKKLYVLSDAYIVQTRDMANDLIHYTRLDKSKITVINNPISERIEAYSEQYDLRRIIKADYLICVGRLEKQKAFHYAIEAFAKVAERYPTLKLKLVGKGSLEWELKEQAAMQNLTGIIEFEGYQADIIPYYLQARATVLTSLFEGFPNVLAESIALGTPVVAFDCPSGPDEIIVDGVNGYLVRYQDLEHLVECLQKVLNNQLDISKVMKSADRFKSERIVQKYIKVLTVGWDNND